MKNICILSNSIKDENLELGKKIRKDIVRLAKEAGIEGINTPLLDLCDDEDIDTEGIEAIIVIGGDGSVLSAAKRTIGSGVPLIGFNLGAVGFLAEVEPSDSEKALKRLLTDDIKIEERMMLRGSVYRNGEVVETGHALNDVVIARRGDMMLSGYSISVNGSYLSDFRADGIIISTPTGSTAYNLSAGGAIVKPDARLIQMTPVAAHLLNNRSVIFSGDDVVAVSILPSTGRHPVATGVSFDGNQHAALQEGDVVKVTSSGQVTRIIRLSDDGFLQILQKKMV
ncbi:MAG: NAD(+)/NADH kinase [Lachnospiraceae bacterium]|nr:NAD(+)/NADH kinase [Lachnospiraceae bacterium]